jgi:hypothetical protein
MYKFGVGLCFDFENMWQFVTCSCRFCPIFSLHLLAVAFHDGWPFLLESFECSALSSLSLLGPSNCLLFVVLLACVGSLVGSEFAHTVRF